MAKLEFGRDICGDFAAASAREWLVVNGIGGFAAGTLSGALSRRYHGLLIAALEPPLGRTLLFSKADEVATIDGKAYALGTNLWQSGAINPDGYRHIESFGLEGTTPVWNYALAETCLQKRIFMRRGENTTYLLYRHVRGRAPITLVIRVLANYRDYHGTTQGGLALDVSRLDGAAAPLGLRIVALGGTQPAYLLGRDGTFESRPTWYHDFALPVEKERGFDGHEDHLCVGEFHATLLPGGSLSLCATTERGAELDGERIYKERQREEQELLIAAQATEEKAEYQQLVLAADQFIVERPSQTGAPGYTILAGYPWFADWGRDTMISLAGLTLCTGRPDRARSILCTFARFLEKGMLPNRFPDSGTLPEYNTVDATLYYFEALRAYVAATRDEALLSELFPQLLEIRAWHRRGTRYGIRVTEDGLLYAGEPGVQLTWMDAKIGDWVVTPRHGKPVEVNAFYFNALCVLAEFAERLEKPAIAEELRLETETVRKSYARFMNPSRGFLYDVLDGPSGHDASLRPNQIWAVALPFSPLSAAAQKAVVDVCARHLVTSYGLRSLGPEEPGYIGRYLGTAAERDGAYHQGTAWCYLLGPFAIAHYRVYGNAKEARSYLAPLLGVLGAQGIGSLGEICDGDPPHLLRGCIAQAWSVAEFLRAEHFLKSACACPSNAAKK